MALSIAACSLLPGREFVFGFPPSADVPELRGVLTDTTGTVTRVTTVQGLNPPPAIDRGMMTFLEEPNALLVHWLGGRCDDSVRIAVTPAGGVTVTVATTVSGGVCDLAGVPRYVRIWFMGPVDATRTTVEFDP